MSAARGISRRWVQGARDDQRGLRLDAGQGRRPGDARGEARPPAGGRRRRSTCHQRRLRGRLRGRAGGRRARTCARAAETGVAGLSIEDSTRDGDEPLFAFELAVERIRAARAALDAMGTRRRPDRALGGLHRRPARPRRDDPPAAGLRGRGRRLPIRARHLDPRADRCCRQAVAPKPVNVLIWGGFLPLAELHRAGRPAPEHRRRARVERPGAPRCARRRTWPSGSFEGLKGAVKSADIVRSFGA